MTTPQDSHSIYSTDKKIAFVLLCIATLLLLYVKKSFIENETAAFEFLADRPEGTILKAITALQFFSVPLVYLWKFTVIAFVLWLGCFMNGYRITYSQCWGIAAVAECIFLVAELVKIIYFLFIETDPTLYEVKAFYPFSMLNFFDYTTIDKRYAYPLKALNIFEVAYWAMLAYGIHFYTRRAMKVSWIIVFSSYVVIFLIWLLYYCIVYH